MADQVRQVETQFTVVDKATSALNKIHSSASRFDDTINKITESLGSLGSLAAGALGGFDVGTAVAGATQYLRTVRDISAATGFTASNVDAVLEVMDRANISAGEGSQIIQKLSISMQRYRMEVEKSGKATSDAAIIIQRLGLSLDKGPVAAMLQLSKAAKAGRLSMADLNIGLQIGEEQAIRLQTLLQRGPQVVGRIMGELQEQGLAINAQNIAAFNRYEEATIRIRSAWSRIAIVVASKVMPIIGNLLEKVRDRVEGWTTSAVKWGEMISGWLDRHLATVITIGKVMAANFAIQKLTGKGFAGIAAGIAKKRMVAAQLLPGAGGAAPAMGAGAGRVAMAMAPLLGYALVITAAVAVVAAGFIAIRDNFMGVRDEITGMWDRIMGHFAAMGVDVKGFIGPLNKLFTRESALGKFFMLLLPRAIIFMLEWVESSIIGARTLIRFAEKLFDIGTRIFDRISVVASKAWAIITDHFKLTLIDPIIKAWVLIRDFFVDYLIDPIQRAMSSLFDWLFDALRPFMALAGIQADLATKEVGAITGLKESAGIFDLLQESWREVMQEANAAAVASAAAQAAAAGKPPGADGPPTGRPPPPVYDFRGSRFDITQQFAEGFDPDRIAVAFSNDLAALGERRLQSAITPPFAIR